MSRRHLGLLAAGLYLVSVAVAAVIAIANDDLRVFYLGVVWEWAGGGFMLGDGFPEAGDMAAGLAVVAVLNAWMFWQVLRLPPRADKGADRRVIRLRRLLYLAAAYSAVLWLPSELLPDALAEALFLLVWAPLWVTFLLVLTGESWRFRALGLVFAAICVALSVESAIDELPGVVWPNTGWLLSLVDSAWLLMILLAQRRDERWSRATVTLGLAGLTMPFAFEFFGALLVPFLGPEALVINWLSDELNVFYTVWLARSAHELAGPGAGSAPAGVASGGPPRAVRIVSAAVVLVPVIGMIEPEERPRLTYSGWDDRCYEWTMQYRPYGDTRPEDRERAFICHARTTMDGVPPMFPDTLADQYVLAYGRRLCQAREREEQVALLEEAGSERSGWGADPDDLVFLCPDVVGARQPDLLRSEAEKKADEDRFVAEENARCPEAWPRVRARREGTSAYFLFEGGGYAVYDPEGEIGEESWDAALDDGFVGAAGGAVTVMTESENQPMCLTVKAFDSAPPLRLKGWEQVTEVGVVSTSGRLLVPMMEDGAEQGTAVRLPNLAVKGPGRYRVRVYAGGGEDAYEQHLIVVFPGRSGKKVEYVR
ncbi:hypothetical protein Ssi03_34460 [Sphaerisporangium siamense]|uniref:Uncharacterized protein n=1 Tax=Sphaerisporangium siamense TaxID=795645 RepID=A0A7W7G7E9_9ACTN|nr:hypothetical protein [Sphaerisporangium siamense]MBB4698484.1 hypothetical protein [Sphaerisporangium siamense]GII85456.1 hypothetical protein Ssi03_34460 [Sphaerisporangium siamense]